MTHPAPRLAMVAGEASGDLLASLLLQGLHQRWPGAAAAGIGGPNMQAQGFDAWWPSQKLSVFGYVDALRHLPELLSIRRDLRNRVLAEQPEVFVGVDAPDFNFALETSLRAAGLRTVHFVCPSIWAWRAERVNTLAAAADHVLCLFPFEPELLAKNGVAATYVGHPAADLIPLEVPRAQARAALGLDEADTVVALLPGSRKSEITYIAPPMLMAAQQLLAARPQLKFVLPVAPGLRELVQVQMARHAPTLPVNLLDSRSHEALAACDLTLIASGTATLEAALFKRPMVIVYKLSWLNYQLMKGKGYLPWFGLPNILERDFVVPELIQDAATPEAIAREAAGWLDDPARCAQLTQRFSQLHLTLRQDTARKATDAIAKVLGRA